MSASRGRAGWRSPRSVGISALVYGFAGDLTFDHDSNHEPWFAVQYSSHQHVCTLNRELSIEHELTFDHELTFGQVTYSCSTVVVYPPYTNCLFSNCLFSIYLRYLQSGQSDTTIGSVDYCMPVRGTKPPAVTKPPPPPVYAKPSTGLNSDCVEAQLN